jgi:hypothetical protein
MIGAYGATIAESPYLIEEMIDKWDMQNEAVKYALLHSTLNIFFLVSIFFSFFFPNFIAYYYILLLIFIYFGIYLFFSFLFISISYLLFLHSSILI